MDGAETTAVSKHSAAKKAEVNPSAFLAVSPFLFSHSPPYYSFSLSDIPDLFHRKHFHQE